MDEEYNIKEKKIKKSSFLSKKVRFTVDDKNEEPKAYITNSCGSLCLSKEEIIKTGSDPFWVKSRISLIALFWVVWFSMLIIAILIVWKSPDCPLIWWKKTTIYEVFVHSFKDSNNDGMGDLKGLISKLDYFEEIGVETLILSPIYPLEMNVSLFNTKILTSIDPRYGSLDDFDFLVEEMHRSERNMKLIIDLIPKNMSDRHNCLKRVFWNEFGFNQKRPNLRSIFKKVIEFWLKRKVDGIRFNIGSYLLKEMFVNKTTFIAGTECNNTELLKIKENELNFEILKEFGRAVRRFGQNKVIISESYETTEYLLKYYGKPFKPLMDLALNFDLMNFERNIEAYTLKQRIESWHFSMKGCACSSYKMTRSVWSAVAMGNQNFRRLASRMGQRLSEGIQMLAFILPGNTPIVYYGDEIGMTDTYYEALNTTSDSLVNRSLMQWNQNSSSAGFNDSQGVNSWHRMNSSSKNNVESQMREEFSQLKVFKKLVQLRKSGAKAILLGEIHFPNNPFSENVFVMIKTSDQFIKGENGYLLAINLNMNSRKRIGLKENILPEKGKIILADSQSLNKTDNEISFSDFELEAQQSVLVEFSPLEW